MKYWNTLTQWRPFPCSEYCIRSGWIDCLRNMKGSATRTETCFGAWSKHYHGQVRIHVRHLSFGRSNHRHCSQTLVWTLCIGILFGTFWSELDGKFTIMFVTCSHSYPEHVPDMATDMFWVSCGRGLRETICSHPTETYWSHQTVPINKVPGRISFVT